MAEKAHMLDGLLKLLNAALGFRKEVMDEIHKDLLTRVSDPKLVESKNAEMLGRLAQGARIRAGEMNHEHGAAQAEEMILAAELCFAIMNLNKITEEEKRSGKKVEDHTEEDKYFADIDRIEAKIPIVINSAKKYGDIPLILRCLELKSTLYNFIGDIVNEVKTDELAVGVSSRAIPAVTTLVGSYWRLIESANVQLVQETCKRETEERAREESMRGAPVDDDSEESKKAIPKIESKEESKIRLFLLEHNFKCWHEIEWLRDKATQQDPDFKFDDFLIKFKVPVFAVSVYIGMMLANPFVSEWKKEDVTISDKGFELALHIAKITDNMDEYCQAFALRARVNFGRSSGAVQDKVISELKELEEKYHPDDDEIRNLLRDIEQQRSTFGKVDAENADSQVKAYQKRVAEQISKKKELEEKYGMK